MLCHQSTNADNHIAEDGSMVSTKALSCFGVMVLQVFSRIRTKSLFFTSAAAPVSAAEIIRAFRRFSKLYSLLGHPPEQIRGNKRVFVCVCVCVRACVRVCVYIYIYRI